MDETEISKLTDAINALANALVGFVQTKVTEESKQASSVETQVVSKPSDEIDCPITYSEQNVKDATLAASRAGHKDAIREKLAEYKAKRIQQLTSDQTIDFMDWLASLDNKS